MKVRSTHVIRFQQRFVLYFSSAVTITLSFLSKRQVEISQLKGNGEVSSSSGCLGRAAL